MDILVGRLSCCSLNVTLLNIVLFHTYSESLIPYISPLGHQYSLQYGTLTNNIYRKEEVYITPKLSRVEYFIPQTIKPDILPPELSKPVK